MIWRKRGEIQGSWIGPMQVAIQESPQIVWVTRQSKLYRIAPEHVRPLTAVEEQETKMENNLTNPLVQGVTQYWDLTQSEQSVQGHQSSVPTNIPSDSIPGNPNDNFQTTTATPETDHNHHNTHDPEPREEEQPDNEPSVTSIPSGNVSGMDVPESRTDAVSLVNVPIPVSDDDELLAQEECFHCDADYCWKIEVNINQQDIDHWRQEESPCEMAFLVSAAKKQRSEIKLNELTEEDRKLFQQAKDKEIDSWISTDTVARIARHQIPLQNILRCRWILTWKPVDGEVDHKGNNSVKPKTRRLVVLGYQDPDVDAIPRDSPTMTKLSRMMILQYAASQRWEIESFDIKTAFLRVAKNKGIGY